MIKYNKDVICILKKSEEEMFESNSKLVDINHLILATLKLNNNVKKLLNKKMSFGEMWVQFGQDRYNYDKQFMEVSNYIKKHKLKK